jgi:mannosyltransferase OCH1-like enzyme
MVQEAKEELFKEVKEESAMANKAHKQGNNVELKNALMQVSKLAIDLQNLVGNESRLERALYRARKGKVSNKTIPKIIHHIYKVDLSKTSNWPNDIWATSYKAWMKHFPEPEYEHLFWPDENVTAFFKERCPAYYNLYHSKNLPIERADLSRYCILKELGGIYADLDYEPRQNFFKEFSHDTVNLVQSPYISETVQNSLMASPPHHPYWEKLMNAASQKHFQAGASVLEVSGPKLLDSLQDTHVRSGPRRVHVLPCNQFQRATKYIAIETHSTLKKGCRILAPSDWNDQSLKGIHWGTVSWIGTKGGIVSDPSSRRMFDWFHHMEASSLAEISPSLSNMQEKASNDSPPLHVDKDHVRLLIKDEEEEALGALDTWSKRRAPGIFSE